MEKHLPARPNLDHLRRQAKTLLSALESGDSEAVATILQFLPSAKELDPVKVPGTRFRLADAQLAIARKTGFSTWPHLARHVDQLRALEGIWAFTRLETDGFVIPASALTASRILIDGDRFRTESPEAIYEGIFNINVEAQPHEIDIEFIAGPEAGNSNFGIYCFAGDQLEICLNMQGKPRPEKFGTFPGSGQAYETLKRISHARPEAVAGGTPPATSVLPAREDGTGFEFIESPTLTRLQGQWQAVKITRDGQDLPSFMLATGLRTAVKNEIKISIGGQTMIHAQVRLDEKAEPMQVDYYNFGGPCKGMIQHGLLKWSGEEACFCMAAPGRPRPEDFTCVPGSERTFSQWRLKR